MYIYICTPGTSLICLFIDNTLKSNCNSLFVFTHCRVAELRINCRIKTQVKKSLEHSLGK